LRYAQAKAFFNFIINECGLDMKNPCAHPLIAKQYENPKPAARKILDKELVDELIYSTASPRDRLILELQARCGLRIGEVFKLKVSDVLDRKQATYPRTCNSVYAAKTPADAKFNGILGVGLFAQDCGPVCQTSAGNGQYFSCSGSKCSGTTVIAQNQVQNPVASLPVDKNGVIVELPSVPLSGASSITGSLVLGIGTQSNNIPFTVTVYPASTTYGEFLTTFNGKTYSSIIDSGSKAFFFRIR
jgi:membrane-associated protease RseP (regulator of RpoE activity)